MSETRSSFHVPAPRADGASTGDPATDGPGDPGRPVAETGDTDTTASPSGTHTGPQAAPGHGERRPSPAGPNPYRSGAEAARAARWPVPDGAEPPTGAWDRQRPRGGEPSGPLWPVAEQPATAPRRGLPLDDDPETFTFERPAWPEPPADGTGPRQALAPEPDTSVILPPPPAHRARRAHRACRGRRRTATRGPGTTAPLRRTVSPTGSAVRCRPAPPRPLWRHRCRAGRPPDSVSSAGPP